MKPILKLEHVKKYFPIFGGVLYRRQAQVHAVDDVSFEMNEGETLGLVGESGCGKSTLGRCIIKLYDISEGRIWFDGHYIEGLTSRQMLPVRRSMQMIFQDPYDSLNPRHAVEDILSEPFMIHRTHSSSEISAKVQKLLDRVGLPQNALHRYPHEFSGGQRQRLGIARAIALSPKLIICDEPVSALDVSIQSQIINLLLELQQDLGLSLLFISHDLAVVKHISDRIAVMYLGQIVEVADALSLYQRPIHPYTKALVSAIPVPDPTSASKKDRIVLQGDVPSPIHPPTGCRFHPRCPWATEICSNEQPTLRPVAPESASEQNRRFVACHHADQFTAPLYSERHPFTVNDNSESPNDSSNDFGAT